MRPTFINIGERTNVTGSAKFRKLIAEGDYAAALDVARQASCQMVTLAEVSSAIEQTAAAVAEIARGAGFARPGFHA